MAQNHGALVVVGSGPGIGSHSAAHFARKGFERIILMSRNAARLRVDAVLVQSAAPEAVVDIIPVDLSINSSVRKALIDVDKILDGMPLECVIFNAANSSKSDMMNFAAEDLQRDLHIAVVSLFTTAKWAFPQLLELAHNDGYKPSLLVTSGTICQDPYPPLFSLSACKAAQYNMVTSFSKVYGPQGIHCGLVVVGGRLRDDKHIAGAPQVAEQVWTLFNQSEENWLLEITLTDAQDEKEGDKQYMEADGHSVQPIHEP